MVSCSPLDVIFWFPDLEDKALILSWIEFYDPTDSLDSRGMVLTQQKTSMGTERTNKASGYCK